MTPEKSINSCKSILGSVWISSNVDENASKHFKALADYPQIICDLLASRCVRIENVESFLAPTLKRFLSDPFLLKDMRQGVDRTIQAINLNEPITVYGDYDVDGATSTALFIRFFRLLGIEIGFYIPDRQEEGYGPNIAAFEKLSLSGTKLIITVDCGTLSFEPIAVAKKLGTDVIVIDHHAGSSTHPDCVALINPNRVDEESSLKHLAAVGVSFMTCVALTQTLREQGYFKDKPLPDLISLLDIVALGTVCDVVALTGLNRAFVTQGLKVLRQSQNKGLLYLMSLLNIDKSHVSPYHLGFVIGPRINAGGRIGMSTLGTLLLSSEDDLIVQTSAEQLNLLNEDRKLLQEAALLEADAQVNPSLPIVVVSSDSWHQGVIGIVAGRLKDKYHKPTFVIALDSKTGEGKASARSIAGFDIGNSIHLAHEQNVILQGGGHPMAGGFSLKAEGIDSFTKFMTQHVTSMLSSELALSRRIFDGYLSLNSLSLSLFELIEQLGPFGSGNPAPRFVFQNVTLKKVIIMQEKHIRCFLEDPISGKTAEAVIFQAFQTLIGDFLIKHQYKQIDILGILKKDTWQARTTVKIWIEDVGLSS